MDPVRPYSVLLSMRSSVFSKSASSNTKTLEESQRAPNSMSEIRTVKTGPNISSTRVTDLGSLVSITVGCTK